MKIVTIGMSPFALTANGKLHSWILKYFYLKGNEVAGLVWGHDTTYFVPEDTDGEERYFYDFEFNNNKLKIPIHPFQNGSHSSAVEVYELISRLKPDIVITVGDFSDCVFMKAVRTFCTHKFKWVAVYLPYSLPLPVEYHELAIGADRVLCSSKIGEQSLREICKKPVEYCMLGCKSSVFRYTENTTTDNRFRLMAMGKNCQSDNLATIMRVAADLRKVIPLELYIHANVYDSGEYDLEALKARYDPDNCFITFPQRFVSFFDGLTEDELVSEYQKSNVIISIPMVAATSISVIEAVACGCFPIMSDCGSNRDLCELLLSRYSGDKLNKEHFLVPCIDLLTVGGVNLSIANPDALYRMLLGVYKQWKTAKGCCPLFAEIVKHQGQLVFLKKLSMLAEAAFKTGDALYLEAHS